MIRLDTTTARRLLWTFPLSALVCLSLAGCDGTLGSSSDGEAPPEEELVPGVDDIPSPSTRYRRLTHSEWVQSTVDLLKISPASALSQTIADSAKTFRSDPRQGGYLFAGNADALKVDSSLWGAYQRAAIDVAEAVSQSATDLARLVPKEGSDAARAGTFIEEFGFRAHRRPLTADQKADYLSLYQSGTTAYPDMPGFTGGIRLLLEAFLQSPHFVYRVENAALAAQRSMVPLDGYERATRLSYFFWGTMPDGPLFDAAKAGELNTKTGVEKHAARLASDPRAEPALVDFLERVIDTERYSNVSPSSAVFPDVPETFTASLLQETRRFISGEIFDGDGGLRELLTSSTSYVNDDLATVYGLSGTFDSTFRKVALDPNQRAGVLTQAGFLASHSTSSQSDPIHRGVFIAKRINCIPISAPPDDIPPLPTPSGQSNRQLVAEHTEQGTCKNCHESLINPYGFVFENYDAIGQYRTEDGPHPVDASAEISTEEGAVPVENALEMVKVLAESEETHRCFSDHLVAYAQGRPTTKEDVALIRLLGEVSQSRALPFRDLMVHLATSDSFLNRPED